MLPLIAAMLGASPVSDSARTAAVCEVVRLALKDLPTIDANRGYAKYHGISEHNQTNVLNACPSLKKYVPASYPLANEVASARAAVHGPILGHPTPLTMLFVVGIPELSADLKTADIAISYSCTGLCGANFVAHYVWEPEGWRREGSIRILAVS